ncbi:hypothetical protein E2C01_101805 [Portunus trituberculatus]|uniref:Uncharacterized protein n=1 Tax=Portunus trituberculatus TaxID=210409 RepID=A0A5B7KGN5_PORTR|nr:hypothetical protein [Portunus trituberculatus]
MHTHHGEESLAGGFECHRKGTRACPLQLNPSRHVHLLRDVDQVAGRPVALILSSVSSSRASAAYATYALTAAS